MELNEKRARLNFADFLENGFEKKGEKIIEINRIKTSGNISFIIKTNKLDYFLRLCGEKERYRTGEEVHSEIELLDILAKEGIPVPRPIELDGKRILWTNKGAGMCYEFLRGKPIKEFDAEKYFILGKSLGKIHKITRNLELTYERKAWGVKKTKEKFLEVKQEINKNDLFIQNEFVKIFEKELGKIKFFKGLPRGMIHEDLGKRHVLFDEDKISGIVDWDRSYEDILILDLGQVIRGWCFDDWELMDRKKLNLILEGYQTERKLNLFEKFYLKKAIKFAFLERALSFAIKFLNEQKEEDLEFAVKNLELAREV